MVAALKTDVARGIAFFDGADKERVSWANESGLHSFTMLKLPWDGKTGKAAVHI